MQSRNSLTLNRAMRWPALAIMVVVCLGACGGPGDVPNTDDDIQARPTPVYPVTVSGVSSGAYMAVQTHVALADRVAGVGAVAGGPYHCAAGSVSNALGRCISGEDIDVASLLSFTREASIAGEIAATGNLQDDRVWIFNSPKDVVVGQKVAAALGDFYRELVLAGNIRFVDDIDAAHGWPTMDTGNTCLEIGGDFINACGFDTAGKLLNHLYDNLAPRAAESGSEKLTSIDLSDYFESASKVADTGYIFVPNSCHESDAECRLHIFFHGCRQGAEFLDDRFAATAGFNEWASDNRIVVVYPQIESSLMNPQGCWDWWGYTGSKYDLKSGKQISGIDKIITAFASDQLY